MKKKILTIIISALLVMTALPQAILAENEEGNFENEVTVVMDADLITEDNALEDVNRPKDKHQVKFVSGVEGWIDEIIMETNGTNYILPSRVPVKEGYAFVGWFTKKGVQITEDDIVNLKNDMTLYAHWNPLTYQVAFYGNYDGSTYEEKLGEVYDSKYVFPENNPTRLGHKFAGWWTEPEGGTQVTKNTVVKGSGKLYAHWEEMDNVDVNFICGEHGKIVEVNLSLPYGSTYVIDGNDVIFNNDEKLKVSAMPDEGYMLKSWNVVPKEKDDVIYDDVTFFAKFIRAVAEIEDWDGNITKYDNLFDALKVAGYEDTVRLLQDIDTNKDIVINDYVILDLNHHTLKTKGKIHNVNGTIMLYQKNLELINHVLDKKIQGCYGFNEDIDIYYHGNRYFIPEDTFTSYHIEQDPYSVNIGIVAGDGNIDWYGNVNPSTNLKVTYDLALKGNILAPNNKKDADTIVCTTGLALLKDIQIGSNKSNFGFATLYIKSYDNPGFIVDNDYRIILNKTGKLIVSENVKLDESILVPGIKGMIIDKAKSYDEEREENIYIYSLALNQEYINDEYTINYDYDGELEFITSGQYRLDKDVVVKVDDVVVDPSNYDLTHGSIHVTLHNDYLKTLSSGEHTITIGVKNYKTISQKFYINPKPTPKPSPKHIIPKTGVDF